MQQPSLPPDDLRADAARNRAQVLKVARKLLEAGDETLPMNTIARLAGVGVGTVYRHFPTRQVLLESLAMSSFEKLLGEAQAAASDDDPASGLARLLRAALNCQLRDSGLGAVLQSSESACVQTSELRLDLFTAVSRLLGRAREAGAIRPDIGADDLRRLLCGTEYAVRIGTRDHGEVDRYVSILLSGLQPPH